MKKLLYWLLKRIDITAITVIAAFYSLQFVYAHTVKPEPFNLSPGIGSHQLEKFSPAIGNINGVKISIPHNYLLAGVQYEGEEPIMMESRKFMPSFESKIKAFSILNRTSNFQPIKTPQDADDYYKAQNRVIPSSYEDWMTVGFTYDYFFGNNKDKDFEKLIHYYEKDNILGPFLNLDNNSFGLSHDGSLQALDNRKFNPYREIFYEGEHFNTFIMCETHKQVVKPFSEFNSCHHYFILPKINIFVEATYTKKDVPRWREIEKELSAIMESFIVK